jgi:hypothetical protein
VNKASTNGVTGGDSPHEYEQLVSLRPSRPAPRPPGGTVGTYSTIAAYSGKFFMAKVAVVLHILNKIIMSTLADIKTTQPWTHPAIPSI